MISQNLKPQLLKTKAPMVTNWLTKNIARTLVRLCPLCRMPLADDHAKLCRFCLQRLLQTSRCPCCGLQSTDDTSLCGQCLQQPPLWQRLYCVGDYQPPLSGLVHQLKYQRQPWLAGLLAELLLNRVTHKPDIILSVPMHWQRYWRRGYNQSDLLARQLARRLAVPYQPGLVKRTIATKAQQRLDRQQRLHNLTGAFALAPISTTVICGAHLALVDDVVTTGSTMTQMCQLLLAAGAESIDIYCICRTPD